MNTVLQKEAKHRPRDSAFPLSQSTVSWPIADSLFLWIPSCRLLTVMVQQERGASKGSKLLNAKQAHAFAPFTSTSSQMTTPEKEIKRQGLMQASGFSQLLPPNIRGAMALGAGKPSLVNEAPRQSCIWWLSCHWGCCRMACVLPITTRTGHLLAREHASGFRVSDKA